jgi:putative sigma-54 modulation protein
MKLIYSGKSKDFTPELEEKITVKLGRLSRLVEQRGEREIHLAHQVERHLHKIEITMNFYDHSLVGEGSDPELVTAVCDAIEKLEKQLVRIRERWRDTHRDAKSVRSGKESWEENEAQPAGPIVRTDTVTGSNGRKPKIFRVNYTENRKPMTLEEAVIEIGNDLDYYVYRDAEHNCLAVLVRRMDGNFDLIQS